MIARAVVLSALLVACVPSPHPTAPEADSGDGGRRTCEADCASRAAAGCLDPDPRVAGQCVPMCELARQREVYDPCTRCEHYVSTSGAERVRCLR